MITVFDEVQSPCKFGKISVVGNFIEQNFILKIFALKINSRKIFLIFLFIRYDTAIIQLLLWKIFLMSLLLQDINEVRKSNIFLFFLYIWSFRVNSIFNIIRICFLLSKLNINWFLLYFIVFLQAIAIKGLSIESLLWGNGDGALKVFGDWDNLLGPSLSQNRRREDIQWSFACARFPSHLCPTVYARARTRDLWRQDGEVFTREI